MIIGGRELGVSDPSPKLFRFDRNELSFKAVATYLTALHGFMTMTEAYNNDGKGAVPWAADDVALFDGSACSIRLEWSPHETVSAMVRNAWPHKIDFLMHSAAPVIEGTPLNLGVLEHFMFGLGQALLTNFVEEQKSFLKEKHGAVAKWPPVWNFARVIRNAMAHGGSIRIDDNTKVEWKRLRYSKGENGRRIINVDIWPADLFILIKEMEQALRSA